jgi:hypothetical protein
MAALRMAEIKMEQGATEFICLGVPLYSFMLCLQSKVYVFTLQLDVSAT